MLSESVDNPGNVSGACGDTSAMFLLFHKKCYCFYFVPFLVTNTNSLFFAFWPFDLCKGLLAIWTFSADEIITDITARPPAATNMLPDNAYVRVLSPCQKNKKLRSCSIEDSPSFSARSE
jgi:hypothetical protein